MEIIPEDRLPDNYPLGNMREKAIIRQNNPQNAPHDTKEPDGPMLAQAWILDRLPKRPYECQVVAHNGNRIVIRIKDSALEPLGLKQELGTRLYQNSESMQSTGVQIQSIFYEIYQADMIRHRNQYLPHAPDKTWWTDASSSLNTRSSA